MQVISLLLSVVVVLLIACIWTYAQDALPVQRAEQIANGLNSWLDKAEPDVTTTTAYEVNSWLDKAESDVTTTTAYEFNSWQAKTEPDVTSATAYKFKSWPDKAEPDVTSTTAPADMPGTLTEGCSQVYLDIGSNVGVQVRKLFEPHLYPNSKVLPIFDRVFGGKAHRSRPSSESGLCAFGFEANPRRERRLKTIESVYRRKGWRVHFFVPRPVSDVGGREVTLWVNLKQKENDPEETSASIADNMYRKGEQQGLKVKTLDITAWILKNIKDRSFSPKNDTRFPNVNPYVLAKMDVEGTEYQVIPRMIQKRVLCSNIIQTMFIEWHKVKAIPRGPRREEGSRRDASKHLHESVLERTNDITRCRPYAITKMIRLDDELYWRDGKPL